MGLYWEKKEGYGVAGVPEFCLLRPANQDEGGRLVLLCYKMLTLIEIAPRSAIVKLNECRSGKDPDRGGYVPADLDGGSEPATDQGDL